MIKSCGERAAAVTFNQGAQRGGKWRLFVFPLADGCCAVGSLPDCQTGCSHILDLWRAEKLWQFTPILPLLCVLICMSKTLEKSSSVTKHALVGCLALSHHLCLFVTLSLADVQIRINCFFFFYVEAISVFLQMALFTAGWWKSKERHCGVSNKNSCCAILQVETRQVSKSDNKRDKNEEKEKYNLSIWYIKQA